jgi:hypothetical protein
MGHDGEIPNPTEQLHLNDSPCGRKVAPRKNVMREAIAGGTQRVSLGNEPSFRISFASMVTILLSTLCTVQRMSQMEYLSSQLHAHKHRLLPVHRSPIPENCSYCLDPRFFRANFSKSWNQRHQSSPCLLQRSHVACRTRYASMTVSLSSKLTLHNGTVFVIAWISLADMSGSTVSTL